MPNYFSQIPALNNIQFVTDDVVLPEQYHTLPYFKQWYSEGIKDWQYKRDYYQPIQQTDQQYLIVKRTQFNSVYFKIYSCDGEPQVLRPDETGDEQYRIYANITIEDSGDVYQLPNGEEPLIYHQFNFKFSDFNLPDGTYYVLVPIEYFDGVTIVETRAWISEPILLQEEHPDTVYYEYYNTSNKDDVIFKYDMSDGQGFVGFFVSPRFGLRVEGDVISPSPASSDNSLKEQDYEQRLVNGFTWDGEQAYVGNDHGVPYYMISKLNAIWVCDYVAIDGTRYVKDEGAEWQIDDSKTYPLYAGSMPVRLYDKRDKISDVRGQTITLVPLTGIYPVAVYRSGLGSFAQGAVLASDSDRDDYIDDLNNLFIPQFGFTGVASLQGTDIVYTFGLQESLPTFEPIVLYDHTTWSINIGTANQNMTFEFFNYAGVIDWGDLFSSTTSLIYQQVFEVDATSSTRRHIYPNTGNYVLRLFHYTPQCIGGVLCTKGGTAQQFSCNLLNVTGLFPEGMTELFLRGADFSAVVGGFDLTCVSSCRQNIERLTLRACGIDEMAVNVFSDYSSIGIGGNSANWAQLYSISIFQNQLSQVEQETFINDFYDHAPHVIAGTFNTRQLPANTITDPSATAAISNLNAAGWFTLT